MAFRIDCAFHYSAISCGPSSTKELMKVVYMGFGVETATIINMRGSCLLEAIYRKFSEILSAINSIKFIFRYSQVSYQLEWRRKVI